MRARTFPALAFCGLRFESKGTVTQPLQGVQGLPAQSLTVDGEAEAQSGQDVSSRTASLRPNQDQGS